MEKSAHPLARLLALPIVRFGVVGLSNTLVSFAAFHALLHVLDDVSVRASLAQFGSYALGIGWSFFWNRRWTFRSDGAAGAAPERPASQFVRFATLQAVLMVGSATSLGVLVDQLQQPPTLMWILVMGVVTVLNYVLSRYWAFRPTTAVAAPPAR